MIRFHLQKVLAIVHNPPKAAHGEDGGEQGGNGGDGEDAGGDGSSEGHAPAEPRDRPRVALQLQRGSREGGKVQVII